MSGKLLEASDAVLRPGTMRRLRAVAFVLLVCAPLPIGGVPADQPTSARRQSRSEQQTSAPQRPVFEARVERVRVDVIVTDGDGRFVDNLGFDDFVVYEDGALQQILNVQLVDLGAGTVADLPAPRAVALQPSPEENLPSGEGRAGEDDRRPHVRSVDSNEAAMIFLIDGSSLDPSSRIRFARQWGELLEETKSLNVPRAAYLYDSLGNLIELSPLTHDGEALRAVAAEVESFPAIGLSMQKKLIELINLSVDSDKERQALQQARAYENQELDRAYITLERLTQFCDALSVRGGRTALVWVSTGVKRTQGGPYWAVAGDDPAQLQTHHPGILKRQEALHEAANSANVSIYSIDPSPPGALQNPGLAPESEASGTTFLMEEWTPLAELDRVHEMDFAVDGMRDALRDAAGATGGEAFISAGDMRVVLEEIEEDGRQYYLLTYAVPPPLGDDDYHEIRVDVRREGVDVRSRGGYVDLPAVDRRARSVAAALMVPGAVAVNPIAVKLFRMWSAGGDPEIDLAVTMVGGSKELHAMALSSGEVIDEFHIEVESPAATSFRPFVYVHTWALPPGEQDIRVVVRDQLTGELSATRLELEVPEPNRDWATSDLMLTVSDGDRPPQPLIGDEMTSGERLEIYLEVFGADDPRLSGSIKKTYSRALPQRLSVLDLPRDAGGIHRGALWLEGIPPGQYLLEVVVTDDGAGEGRTFQELLNVLPPDGLPRN